MNKLHFCKLSQNIIDPISNSCVNKLLYVISTKVLPLRQSSSQKCISYYDNLIALFLFLSGHSCRNKVNLHVHAIGRYCAKIVFLWYYMKADLLTFLVTS